MSLLRSTTQRASAIAQRARPARYIRRAELQPWQRTLQRRTYASAHGHGQAKKSDLPWMLTSLTGTAVGLYFVMNQDLSHGEGHGEGHGDAHDDGHHEEPEKLANQPEQSEEESQDAVKEDAKEEDLEGEKNSAKRSDIQESRAKQKGEEPVHKTDDDSSSESPDQHDKPHSRKETHSSNETSGKQKGMSNDDTKHTSAIHDDPGKSKEGEGVAESAKLQGTENKEERGKTRQDKDA